MLPPRKKKGTKRGRFDGRIRSAEHLRWIRGFACCVKMCNSESRIEAHHVKGGEPMAIGKKSGDNFATALCADHHREYHTIGKSAFEAKYGLDMLALAAEFASISPPLKKLAHSPSR